MGQRWRGDKDYSQDTPGIDIYTRTHTPGLDVERRQGLFLGYSRYRYIHQDSYSRVRCGEETRIIPRILQVQIYTLGLILLGQMWKGEKDYSQDTPGIDIYTRTHILMGQMWRRDKDYSQDTPGIDIYTRTHTPGLDVERRQGIFQGYSRYRYIHQDS